MGQAVCSSVRPLTYGSLPVTTCQINFNFTDIIHLLQFRILVMQLIKYTGGRQLPTAAITISQHGGRRSPYKIIFTVHAIIKHTILVLRVCIHRNSMYAFIKHFHSNYMSGLLLLDGGEGNDGLMVIYNSQKRRMMVIAPMV